MSTPAATAALHGERPGVEERAVAEVLDEVGAVEERRHPDPLRSLVAHRGEPGDVADPLGVHQGDHRVAADPAADERPLRVARAQVVRAAAAVERRAVDRERDAGRLAAHGQRAQTVLTDAGRESPVEWFEQPVGVEQAGAGDQQFAALGVPADHPRTFGGVVHRALHEQLEGGVLLLDDEHLGEAVGEVAHLLLVDRYRHEEVEEADAGVAQGGVVGQPEQGERLAQLVVGVAAGGDADPVVRVPAP